MFLSAKIPLRSLSIRQCCNYSRKASIISTATSSGFVSDEKRTELGCEFWKQRLGTSLTYFQNALTTLRIGRASDSINLLYFKILELLHGIKILSEDGRPIHLGSIATFAIKDAFSIEICVNDQKVIFWRVD